MLRVNWVFDGSDKGSSLCDLQRKEWFVESKQNRIAGVMFSLLAASSPSQANSPCESALRRQCRFVPPGCAALGRRLHLPELQAPYL